MGKSEKVMKELELYFNQIDKNGFDETWCNLLASVLERRNQFPPYFCTEGNFGELYELGLEHINKLEKKELGKYYTPEDVSSVLSNWLLALEGDNVADVCCGCGNLIISYLNLIGKEKAEKLLDEKKIYLYELDPLALMICKYRIAIIYGEKYLDNLRCFAGDFLNKKITLPVNCKVIANPPYFKIKEIDDNWESTKVIRKTKEFYCAFIEKIVSNSVSSVLLTPHSFISGTKFYPLRQVLTNYGGFIVSFDNVPGCIFNGRKKGVFNSNTSNAVRASIMVTNKSTCGYRVSPLIRFKSFQRDLILSNTILNEMVGSTYQKIDENNKRFAKCFKDLEPLFNKWNKLSSFTLKDYFSKEQNEFKIDFPNTCRYFTVASSNNLERKGKHIIYARDEQSFYYIYAFLNSSFCYWYWRMYDGGINFSQQLLSEIPVFFDKITEEKSEKVMIIAKEMMENEKKYIKVKKNAGTMQHNIKFPKKYRDNLNKVFLSILGEDNVSCFDEVHSNKIEISGGLK